MYHYHDNKPHIIAMVRVVKITMSLSIKFIDVKNVDPKNKKR